MGSGSAVYVVKEGNWTWWKRNVLDVNERMAAHSIEGLSENKFKQTWFKTSFADVSPGRVYRSFLKEASTHGFVLIEVSDYEGRYLYEDGSITSKAFSGNEKPNAYQRENYYENTEKAIKSGDYHSLFEAKKTREEIVHNEFKRVGRPLMASEVGLILEKNNFSVDSMGIGMLLKGLMDKKILMRKKGINPKTKREVWYYSLR